MLGATVFGYCVEDCCVKDHNVGAVMLGAAVREEFM